MKTPGGISKFERRSVFVLLIFWGIALLCWVPVLVYPTTHPNPSGELDFGGAGLAAITLFVSGVFVLCGVVAVTHAVISFIWRRRRWNNQISNRGTPRMSVTKKGSVIKSAAPHETLLINYSTNRF